jgi:hypothetical protein
MRIMENQYFTEICAFGYSVTAGAIRCDTLRDTLLSAIKSKV